MDEANKSSASSSSLLLLLLLLLSSSLLLLLLLLLSRTSRNSFSQATHSVSSENNQEHNQGREQHFAGEVDVTKKMVYSRSSHHPNA